MDGVIDKLLHKTDAFSLSSTISSYTLDYIVNVIHALFSTPVIDKAYIRERIKKVQGYQTQLLKLKALPVVEQRSETWYNMRKRLITASDFAQALGEGKFGTQKQFYQKKCGYEEEKFNPNVPPLKWGVMFESMAAGIYSARNGMVLHEFGLLPHPTVPFFGASPDGITSLGIMLEIKCPYKRKITGEIPMQYYYQIQGQLDVCGLEECDYLECEFFEYADEQEFLEDTEHLYERGIIIEYIPPDKNAASTSASYVYSDIVTHGTSIKDQLKTLVEWAMQEEQNTPGYICTHYWKLKTYNVVRVYKDQSFVDDKLECLSVVWDKVKEYQDDHALYTKEVGAARASRAGTTKKDWGGTGSGITGYAFLDDE